MKMNFSLQQLRIQNVSIFVFQIRLGKNNLFLNDVESSDYSKHKTKLEAYLLPLTKTKFDMD